VRAAEPASHQEAAPAFDHRGGHHHAALSHARCRG
jgi:hypothetical protein